MTESFIASERSIQLGTKRKSGCRTCRIRKIKCDETKPLCHRCIDTGRACDGYESPFRLVRNQPVRTTHASVGNSGTPLQPLRLTVIGVASLNVNLLNRYFSTKTMFDVELGCNAEAQEVLEASVTDPPIYYAISSLKALREELDRTRDVSPSIRQQHPNYDYGLQQYCMALRGLASSLAFQGPSSVRSVLLCCQIFVSIEQVRSNYDAMAEHIIQGLSIMHQHRARPYLDATKMLLPARCGQLPLLDVFIIKLCSAPCKFAELPETVEKSGPLISVSPPLQPAGFDKFRTIAPDMRTRLTRIATLTLEFLERVSHVELVDDALSLASEKAFLLNALESWLVEFDMLEARVGSLYVEPLSTSFLRLFHQILRLVLLRTLCSLLDVDVDLDAEHARLRVIANYVGDRVKHYGFLYGPPNESSKIHSQKSIK